ncbi:MAG: anaerobic C4-dicarboxylate transporter [Anaerobiospirillum sp.]|nr:anaerobic C4-dicarboxylate transporter [Anaerobiospirillum sp.]
MDIVLILRLLVLFGVIFFGIRLGGMAIGYTGGLGVIILTVFLGMNAGAIPTDVILIIMSVIAAITALQKAGGLDYMVRIAERILRNNPKHINFLAPTVTYVLTVLAGTGHTAFAMIPVIVEVAKEQNVKPAGPLSMAVVSGQVAITASPVSAAVVYMTGVLEPYGWSYPTLLIVWLLTTYVGCMIAALIMSLFFNKGPLDQDPEYLARVKAGLIHKVEAHKRPELPATAKSSVIIFITGVICVVLYATMISDLVRLPIVESLKASDSGLAAFLLPAFEQLKLARDGAIMSFMLLIATLIVIKCKLNTSELADTPTFKSGMTACICVLGVAWLGNTFVAGYSAQLEDFSKEIVAQYPGVLSVVLFFISALLYSQAATAKALVPVIIVALNMDANPDLAYILVASFAAVSGLFILPTYPTLLGAVQMDDTGTTKIGKFIFNHSMLLPCILCIFISVALGFVVAPLMS